MKAQKFYFKITLPISILLGIILPLTARVEDLTLVDIRDVVAALSAINLFNVI
jgi:hypothetical protein